ncbi:hypothetical protein [Alicyclobacillus suci]|uniref:hypothetical protein n=1 Tax=Alicyclobacillus suci TaxID=2816080 RepID=UPI001A8D99C2|nr:hypothetical protein [Alicyclobacillus suci]
MNGAKTFHVDSQWMTGDFDSKYLVEMQIDFHELKRSMQSLSGVLMLVQFKTMTEATQLLTVLKETGNWLAETLEHLSQVSHRGRLEDFRRVCVNVCMNLQSVHRELVEWVQQKSVAAKHQAIHKLLMRLQYAHQQLRRAASFSPAFEMVSLNTSCACAHQ